MIGNLIGNSTKAIVKVGKLKWTFSGLGSNILKLLTMHWVEHFAFVNKTFFVLTAKSYLDEIYKINLLRQLEKATCRHESGRVEKTLKIQTWY